MKRVSYFLTVLGVAIAIIFSCNTKEIKLVTNVELEFEQNVTTSGFANELLPATFIVTPEAFLPEFEYYIKYEVLEGQGVFLNSEEEILPEGEELVLTRSEDETSFSLPVSYKGLTAGTHRVKVTASDNFEKALDVILNYTINNIPVVWTAAVSPQTIALGQTTTAIITLTDNSKTTPEARFQSTYSFSQGAGALLDADDKAIALNQAVTILPGTYRITITPTTTGDVSISFDLEDSNGQLLNASVAIEVLEEDTIPPTIALNGSNPNQIPVGGTYTEQGAIATDNVDGEFPVPASGITGTVDTSIIGTYSISYNVSDAAGNEAATVTRTINVVDENTPDTEAPIITLNGLATIEITVGGTYTEQGATATDNVDGEFPVPASGITGSANTRVIGTYTITYNVSDASGNEATPVTRTINVVEEDTPDNETPIITLNGLATIEITVGGTYTEQGATATDNVDGEFPLPASGITGTVDTTIIGTYSISYNVSDAAGNEAATVTRTVNVVAAPDTEAPIITLNGPATIEITVGGIYTEQGATATDNVDGEFSVPADGIIGNVDTSVVDTYPITYDATDAAGNEATTVTRTVNVVAAPDTEAPIITLNGPATIEITVGGTYTEQGATATDNIDGEFPVPAERIIGAVDTDVIGTYPITYDATDTAGNDATTVTRTVNVVAAPDIEAPIITLNGPATIEITVGGIYTEIGAIATDNVDGEFPVPATGIIGNVNTGVIGTYPITYDATDTAGNDATTVTRTVNVVAVPDTEAPIVTLNGPATIEIIVGGIYTEIGAIATDNVDGEFPVPATGIIGNVNTRVIGTYNISYNVSDAAGNAATPVTRTIIVIAGNEDPIAVITTTATSGTAPLSVSFGAGNSTDDGTITGYLWNFDDNGAANTAQNTSHTFDNPGTYQVVLTVTDDQGATGTDSVTVTVSEPVNNPPTATIKLINSSGIAPIVPFPWRFDAQATDVDGDALTYSWNFGDGSPLSTETFPTHQFTTAGTFTVVVTVSDGTATATDTFEVVALANELPTAEVNSTISSVTGTPATINFSGAGSTDNDGTITSYFWNFGDDGAANNVITTSVPNASHTYQTAGTYNISLRVEDNKGGVSTADTMVVTILEPNTDPVATNVLRTVIQGNATTITASSMATDDDGDTLIFSSVEPIPSGSGAITIAPNSQSLTYTAPSNTNPLVSFDVTISDGNGGTDTATIAIQVEELCGISLKSTQRIPECLDGKYWCPCLNECIPETQICPISK